MNGADWAAMSDPSRNPQFRRGWSWPPPKRKRKAPGRDSQGSRKQHGMVVEDRAHYDPIARTMQGPRP